MALPSCLPSPSLSFSIRCIFSLASTASTPSAQWARWVLLLSAMLNLASLRAEEIAADIHRSPVDVAVSQDERWVVTANQTSHSASLIQWPDGKVVDEIAVGAHPSYVALDRGQTFFVSCTHAEQIVELRVEDGRLAEVRRIQTPGQPVGLAVDTGRRRLYAALESHAAVAEIDLATGKVDRLIATGRWPRFLAFSAEQQRLGVSTSGDRGVSVIDLNKGETIFQQSFIGLNIGHLHFANDSVYFPWMVYRRNPITKGNIRLGWVLASRIGRFRLDRDERREAISLDPPGKAIADPYGMRLTSDAKTMIVSASGTHELLIYDVPSLPFDSIGGPDHLNPELRSDPSKFERLELGGRPMGLRLLADDNTTLIANYLNDSLQVVDVRGRKVQQTIPLGGPPEPSLARRGEAIFYDARRSLDQWYSCHSCHQDGGVNAVAIDTFNDDSARTFKTVLPLYQIEATKPWTWHGWQTDLRAAMKKSITSTMIGPEPSEEDVDAMIAYLQTLQPPPPIRTSDEKLQAAVQRGKDVFVRAGCMECHRGPHYTDGKVHDVGLGSRADRYDGFNTPTLVRVGRKTKLLHDGRASSLREVLEGDHNPAQVTGKRLTDDELSDLLIYLKQL